MDKPETRYAAGLEIRAGGDGKPDVLTGIALPYGERATMGRFSEEFRAGSLKPAADGVLLNAMHDRGRPLARTPGTLRLLDGPDALRIEADLPDTVEARDTAALVRAGVLTGLSVEFRIAGADGERWEGAHRVVTSATLGAIAVVDKPAYPGASLEARWKAAQARIAPAWRPGI